ncbi:winged helix DNA-binding domain-containing protein [Acidobacteriota bacterium]
MKEDHFILSLRNANRFILDKQHLSAESKLDNIVQIARDIGGLHATSATTPYLSLLARTNSFAKENLQEELYKKKSLAKVTYVRKTMFILPSDRLPTAFAAVQRNAEILTDQHLKYLQLTQKEYETTAKKILEVLRNRGMTLNELKAEIGAVPNLMYIVRMMGFQGILIRGAPKSGWKNSQHSYHPLKEYYPDLDKNIVEEKEAQRFVIKDYITNFGPVTETDITWWTGFLKSRVRELLKEIQEELSTVKISGLGDLFYFLSSQKSSMRNGPSQDFNALNILPCLDPYMMGYKIRDRYLEQKFYSYVFDRSGNATTTILYRGQVVGIWDFEAPLFKYFLFYEMGSEIMNNLKSEAEKIGLFISGKEIQFKKKESMKPLVKRTAAGVLSPLKDS